MDTKKIRKLFFDFFKAKKHEIVDSAPITIKNDPSLMFTNAGMNQFKNIFLGDEIPKCKRIANTQKCLRVSGKHNDLEEVGIDKYHHTMFEMLGNWSFGDYFKENAIQWAWDLLVNVYKLDEKRLYVSIFGGRANDMGYDSQSEIRKLRSLIDIMNLKSKIIAGSVRETSNIIDWFKSGAHIVTCPPQFLEKLIIHPHTKEIAKQFLKDSLKLNS